MHLAIGGNTISVGAKAANTEFSGIISGTGGLTKVGASNSLTLKANNTYTGDTLVNNGTLALASTGGLKFVIGADGVNNKISGIGAGTVTLDGIFIFDLTSASTIIGDSWNIVDAANLIESYGSTFTVGGSFSKTGGGTGPGVWTQSITRLPTTSSTPPPACSPSSPSQVPPSLAGSACSPSCAVGGDFEWK